MHSTVVLFTEQVSDICVWPNVVVKETAISFMTKYLTKKYVTRRGASGQQMPQ